MVFLIKIRSIINSNLLCDFHIFFFSFLLDNKTDLIESEEPTSKALNIESSVVQPLDQVAVINNTEQ